jgi:hypothetical protein
MIEHVYNGVTVLQREDGYWNATAMCRANGKLWADYWRNRTTQEFLAELSRSWLCSTIRPSPWRRSPRPARLRSP